MKRIISIILVSAMCLAMLSVSAFTASADANTINISRVNSYDGATDIVAWASTSSDATVQSIYGSVNDVTFNYWYFILLQYNSANGSYRVVDTSGFDAYGNSTRPDENYTSWTLGSNKIAIMAKTQASDTDGLALLKSMSVGDTLYLNTTVASLANTYGAVSNIYCSTEYIEVDPNPNPGESSEPEDSSEPDVSDDTSDESGLEDVLDIVLDGPETYRPGNEITVTASVDNISTYEGISLLSFVLKYDKEKLVLTNDIIESNYNELDCVSSVPNKSRWENLSYVACSVDEATSVATAKNNGIINVQVLTAYYDFEYFAKEDGDIELSFTFTVKDGATGDISIAVDEESIVVGASTVNGVDEFTGSGSSLTVTEDDSKFDVTIEGPETYLPGGEITITATVNNISGNGVSLIQFPLDYDKYILTNTNGLDEANDDALDCVVSLPDSSWENLSYVEKGTVYVQLLTAETDDSHFAKNDGEIKLSFTFSVSEDATGAISVGVADEDIVGVVNTANDVEKFSGSGSYININEGETSFDIVLDAPDTCVPGQEFTLTAKVSNILSGKGLSLVKFDLKYDSDALTLNNSVDETDYNALLCVDSLPDSSWENLSYAENGIIHVQLLTVETDDSLFAKEDGEITLSFTFTVKEGFDGKTEINVDENSIVGATNTADSYKTVEGFGDSVVVKATSVSYILGDVNEDGQVDMTDYIVAKRAVMGTYTLTESQKLAADVDGSDSLSISDYIMIKRHVMGTYVIA